MLRPCTQGLFCTAHPETAAPFFVTSLKIRVYGNPNDHSPPLTGDWLTSGLATAEAQKSPADNPRGFFWATQDSLGQTGLLGPFSLFLAVVTLELSREELAVVITQAFHGQPTQSQNDGNVDHQHRPGSQIRQ